MGGQPFALRSLQPAKKRNPQFGREGLTLRASCPLDPGPLSSNPISDSLKAVLVHFADSLIGTIQDYQMAIRFKRAVDLPEEVHPGRWEGLLAQQD